MTYQIIYDVEIRKQLAAIDRKYHPLIRQTIEKQLSHQPDVETHNRKPLQRPSSLGADWELRFGPNNRFRVLYRVVDTAHEIYVLAVSIKDGNRLLIGGEEFDL
ncbi:MAG: type II toxin-antitoxin system RelE family toxin [Roseiflexaceae bacterium]